MNGLRIIHPPAALRGLVLAVLSLSLLSGCNGDDIAALPEAAKGVVTGLATATDDTLYAIKLNTAEATPIGPTGVGLLEGVAVSPSGGLYATDTSGNLYSVSPTTGSAALIGPTGLGNIEGLDFNGSTLLAASFASTPTFYAIDVATATPTSIVVATAATGAVRSMAAQDSNTLLVAATNSIGTNDLWRVTLSTGAVTNIGTITIPGNPSVSPLGLDFGLDGKLYGLNGDGTLIVIDPATAAVTPVGATGSQFWLNLAGVP